MKHTYLNTQTRLACLSKTRGVKQDIHQQLQETIFQRRKIIELLENRAKAMVVALSFVKAA